MAAPFGRVGIRIAGDRLAAVELLAPGGGLRAPRSDLARRVCQSLQAYFRDGHYRPAPPLAPAGTPFQRRVWAALCRIPPGRVITYGDLARRLGSAPRAVAGACRANPWPLVVPCHRVVAAGGPGGYMGRTGGRALAVKQWLIAHERGTHER